MKTDDTICALATAAGQGAIAVIRVSGKKAIAATEKVFRSVSGKSLKEQTSHTIQLGAVFDKKQVIDDVLVSVFKAPNSYTGDDSVEISCHGSDYICSRILQLLADNGCRPADPGEFTYRAFMNGKLDLTQAEAVADLVQSGSEAAHKVAIRQLRGGFSSDIKKLRDELINFASLLELELDFSEEDVEFANRAELKKLLRKIKSHISRLLESYKVGNVLRSGIPVTIIGEPNVGKSTLLNALLNDDRAIVSEIPGTTRDTIEDTFIHKGVNFRFIDTAGLRETKDIIEDLGINKTFEKINQASIILYMFDVSGSSLEDLELGIQKLRDRLDDPDKIIIIIANKIDLMMKIPRGFKDFLEMETIFISAKRKENLGQILEALIRAVNIDDIGDKTLVCNTRHYLSLSMAYESLLNAEEGIRKKRTTDLIAADAREVLLHLASITGEIATEDLLKEIFGRFCIGK
ncbi:MAG: tRNA uridine-5-carboxymethylaminomethyl(34) synthesis GTPase MnmE [Bacteroidetes bacterium]|nr:tRNA uridine-5-carboxymethylaminomethyl(34) synthesis GTPase MnmE [Bacteroidota bacterium]MBU1719106.1 tRNA uridine-5-carboxymethylaminomethyl(34) synthesis GTPase MnmE [Bacteroidota bacterium]